MVKDKLIYYRDYEPDPDDFDSDFYLDNLYTQTEIFEYNTSLIDENFLDSFADLIGFSIIEIPNQSDYPVWKSSITFQQDEKQTQSIISLKHLDFRYSNYEYSNLNFDETISLGDEYIKKCRYCDALEAFCHIADIKDPLAVKVVFGTHNTLFSYP